MKLKRVELQGFKSFCDRTELRFQGDGIAAVVGPNGCGKSNLSDAISWVLGEQSAKSLRGARMEDVIFAGTRDRKAVGMASVTMVLVDPTPVERLAPIDISNHPAEPTNGNGIAHAHVNGHYTTKPGEVTITRRLYRSGESEYLIDGRQARLRDIQDIFMGSGLGPESYAIIEQGRIGQILSSKPQDRRAVIEEAAGITKYKARKRLSEARLESAKQNLARVFDILEEVTRQVNSLKRQAAKAKRYGELKEEMDAKLRALLSGRYRVLGREVTECSANLEAATAGLKDAGERVIISERERERIQAVCYDLEAKLTDQRRQLAELNVENTRTRGKLESQVRESGAIEHRMTQGEQETQDLESRLQICSTERAALGESISGLEAEIAAARALMIARNEARDQLQNRVREQEKAIEAGRMQVLRLLGEASTLKNQLAQIDEYLAGVERETLRAQKEDEAATLELDRLAGLRENLLKSLGDRQLELETVTGDRRKTEEELTAQKGAAHELRAQIDGLRAECSTLKAKRDSLDNILSHHTYTTDSVKRLFSAIEKNQSWGFQPKGVLADFVEVDATYERAAEEFLHDELEYVVVEDWEQAEQGMKFLRSDLEGRATFLVEQDGNLDEDANSTIPDRPRLADHIRLSNGLSDGGLRLLPRLARCFIADDESQARDLARQHSDFYFLLPDGRCYHGPTLSGGRKKASGPLALKREMRELASAFKESDRALTERTTTLDALQRKVAELEFDLERLRGLQQTREKDALALQHESRKIGEETTRTQSRISVARLELERLNRERERSTEQREKNHAAISVKDQDREEREAALESAREELQTVEAEAAHIREEHSALRAQLAGLEERHRAEKSAHGRLDQQFREMSARREAVTQEIQRLGEHRSRLLTENIELDRRSSELSEQTLAVESVVNTLAADEISKRESLQCADNDLREMRAEVEAGHLRRSEIEIDLVRRQAELGYLDETARKELNCAVAEIEVAQETPLPDSEAMAESERLYIEVRTRIENLGPINPDALHEFEEAQQRHDFLSAQRQDLIDSIRDTEKAITEIDAVSRDRFVEAFEAINANFKQAFLTLFGGGSGEMRLTDETNANESGIDIIASPPGKKLQNILLLSGGEKALAALALLMAIFKYQPSPFCVLDEVDAPLDEANIIRLTRLLKEMSVDTQFIIITHSKKTMEAAQSMYGVTMQEAGVSKLVSVKFQPNATVGAVA